MSENNMDEKGSEKIKKGQRIDYIDIAKGLGMLAVIWGHVHNVGVSNVLVYSFHMQLFFFISGMMFNQRKYDSLWKLVKNRSMTLLVPYAIYSVATWCVWASYQLLSPNSKGILSSLLQTVIAQGSGGFMEHNVPLWFVTCLFVVEIAYYFICKIKDWLNIVITLAMAVIGHYMLNNNLSFDFTLLPWNLESAMSAMLFYSVGHLFVKHFRKDAIIIWCEKATAKSATIAILLFVVMACGGIYNGHVSLGSNILGKSTILLYAVGFCGLFSMLLLSNFLTFAQGKHTGCLVNGIKWMGRNSFHIMAVHMPYRNLITIFLAKGLHRWNITPESISSSAWQSLISFGLTLVATVITVLVIKKAIALAKNWKRPSTC